MTTPPLEKRRVDVDGLSMAYHERGAGRPIALLHGNPTSSYLWRTVLPALEPVGRCVAPDLIGMGDSDKRAPAHEAAYSFAAHERALDGFFEAKGFDQPLVLVVHDWGSALGFSYARRHPDRVAGIAYMEALVAPFPSWTAFSEQARPIFEAMRSPAGEDLVLEKNVFVEKILPGSVLRALTEEEMAEYRRPYPTPESRWPTLAWPRQIPIEGAPAAMVETIAANARFMAESDMPKLFINAEPGAILVGEQREIARGWKNQEEITVPGIHFIQEDSGPEIGAAVADWITRRL